MKCIVKPLSCGFSGVFVFQWKNSVIFVMVCWVSSFSDSVICFASRSAYLFLR